MTQARCASAVFWELILVQLVRLQLLQRVFVAPKLTWPIMPCNVVSSGHLGKIAWVLSGYHQQATFMLCNAMQCNAVICTSFLHKLANRFHFSVIDTW